MDLYFILAALCGGMKYERYRVAEGDSPYVYIFFSEGPQGIIPKGVSYTPIGKGFFNLGFGDLHEDLMDLDDASRSNNGDRDKVLATVAFTVVSFTEKFPDARIFIEGSTTARTRLYQMGISANLREIMKDFEIKGFTNGDWEAFRRNKNYEAFLVSRK
jgi:hypothetical protein